MTGREWNFDSPPATPDKLVQTIEVDMKFLVTAVTAVTLALTGSMAFAQTTGAMSSDSMSKDGNVARRDEEGLHVERRECRTTR